MSEFSDILLIIVGSLLIIGPFAVTGMSSFNFLNDEGYSLMIYENINLGQIPYRDFDFLYTPLMYYIGAFAMRLWDSLLMTRLLNCIFVIAGSIGVYFISKKLGLGILPSLLYSLYMGAVFNTLLPSSLANALIIFGLLAMLGENYLAAGILVGLAFLTKQNIGIFAGFGLALFSLLYHRWKALLRLAAGFLVVIIPYGIYLIATGSLAGFIYHIFIFPISVRHLISIDIIGYWLNPHLSGEWILKSAFRLLYVLPFAIYGWLLYTKRKDATVVLITILCAMCYLQFYPNKDVAHFVWGFAPSFILLVYMATQSNITKVAGIVLIVAYVALADYGIYFYQNPPTINTVGLNIPRMEGIRVQPEIRNLLETTRFLVGNGTIFVFGHESMFYYITGNHNPVQLNWFFEGNYVTEKLKANMIADLDRAKPQYIIKNIESLPTDYGFIDRYVSQYYKYSASINLKYKVYVRR